MEARRLFLSFHGRIGRKSFWLGLVALTVFSFLGAFLVALLISPFGTGAAAALASPIVTFAAAYPQSCLYAKRLHDLNRSGWWQTVLWAPFVLLFLAGILGTVEGVATAAFLLLLLNVLLIIALWVACGFLPGAAGRNRFGLPEGEPETATAEVFA